MSDTQRDREERQHVIEVLKSWDGYFIGYTSDEVQEALRYAIASIETDLRYDLLYEETSGQADKQADKPITNNDCETCIHNKGVLECDMYGCKYEPATKNDLGVDCISRKEALKAIEDKAKRLKNADTINGLGGAIAILYELPSVLPKVSEGYWFDKGSLSCRCSNCGCKSNKEYAYCPNCGAKMIEPKESEEV